MGVNVPMSIVTLIILDLFWPNMLTYPLISVSCGYVEHVGMITTHTGEPSGVHGEQRRVRIGQTEGG